MNGFSFTTLKQLFHFLIMNFITNLSGIILYLIRLK